MSEKAATKLAPGLYRLPSTTNGSNSNPGSICSARYLEGEEHIKRMDELLSGQQEIVKQLSNVTDRLVELENRQGLVFRVGRKEDKDSSQQRGDEKLHEAAKKMQEMLNELALRMQQVEESIACLTPVKAEADAKAEAVAGSLSSSNAGARLLEELGKRVQTLEERTDSLEDAILSGVEGEEDADDNDVEDTEEGAVEEETSEDNVEGEETEEDASEDKEDDVEDEQTEGDASEDEEDDVGPDVEDEEAEEDDSEDEETENSIYDGE
eukprot:gnl/TRDRNA2_/TRDRNA2_168559_c0_seq1.p1 gnl/TRDRNA2_/TRDRNA2_168559_c0~~gnl/TRDRNA2_/TRDRNA2_168559_c0_seq1.p1  ORF type:complete len:267 (-),score=98.32 gnl/TRDRNA2_/TRDRNA2_168559_c0_seq1:173-973(-)